MTSSSGGSSTVRSATGSAESTRPMLAMPGGAPLDDPGSAYEPKYDGIRAQLHRRGEEVRDARM